MIAKTIQNEIRGYCKQMLIISGAGNIYESASAFRAGKSYSTRHQTEFVSFDLELEGVKSEVELVELECEMLRAAIDTKATQPGLVKTLTFREDQALLGLSGEERLSAEEERRLGAMMMEQGHELVALIQVPLEAAALLPHEGSSGHRAIHAKRRVDLPQL